MALHRLFWIPEDAEPSAGVYVDQPAEELYAVLCLESQRHRVAVIGEDLGTVPAGVRPALRRHGLLRTWVLQTSLKRARAGTSPGVPVGRIPRRAVAALNTHDMFAFAGFAKGDDIDVRMGTQKLGPADARREKAARVRVVSNLARYLAGEGLLPAVAGGNNQGDARSEGAALVSGALAYVARSSAELVLVNLEDLLLETRPQNLPGTGSHQQNWRRKMSVSLEGLGNDFQSDGRGSIVPAEILRVAGLGCKRARQE
jgi:4-alpha-glucanotransferase